MRRRVRRVTQADFVRQGRAFVSDCARDFAALERYEREKAAMSEAFTFRAVEAPPCQGKPTWHGQARHAAGGRWQTVKNASGNCIAYATDQAARDGAKLLRDELWAKQEVVRRGPWAAPEHPTHMPAGCCYKINIKPQFPGDSWVIVNLQKGDEIGDVRVMHYDSHFRVAAFVPGYEQCSPGDTPKMVPEREHWTEDRQEANKLFAQYVIDAFRDGWQPLTIR